MNRIAMMVICLVCLVVGTVEADGPDSRLIRVPGHATKVVPTDELRIVLDLPTEGPSFKSAKAKADSVIGEIRSRLEKAHGENARVAGEVLVLKRKKISWASRSKKLEHRITITLGQVTGPVSDVAVASVDAILSLDDSLTLSEVSGALSMARRAEVRSLLLAEAVDDARMTASQLAGRAGLSIGTVRDIVTGGAVSRYGYERDREELGWVSGFASVSKGFSAHSDLVGEVRVDADILVSFEARPGE